MSIHHLYSVMNTLQARIGTVEQLWICVGLFALFIIGLVIYYCYSKSLGFPEG